MPHLRRRAFFSEEKMCSECSLSVCPAACPYRMGTDGRRATCSRCGEPIFEDDGYYAIDDCRICASCADEITVEELIEGMRLSGVGEFLSLLGFRYYA